MIKRECAHPRCHNLIGKKRSYCSEHEPRDERTPKQRFDGEPWRWLYSNSRWARAKIQAKARDSWRCTAEEDYGRCTVTDRLTVHHREPLWLLWRKCQGREDVFLDQACNVEKLTTLCHTHHREEELRLKGQLQEFRREVRYVP